MIYDIYKFQENSLKDQVAPIVKPYLSIYVEGRVAIHREKLFQQTSRNVYTTKSFIEYFGLRMALPITLLERRMISRLRK